MLRRFTSPKFILLYMLVLQLVWLFGIWITHATTNWQKLVVLGVAGIVGYLIVILIPQYGIDKIEGWIDHWANKEKTFLLILATVLLVGGVFYASQQRVWPFDEEQNYASSRLIVEK